MSKAAIEVITSVQRRRRWSAEKKERLVAASLEPGIGVSTVARQAGIHPSQLARRASAPEHAGSPRLGSRDRDGQCLALRGLELDHVGVVVSPSRDIQVGAILWCQMPIG